MAIRLRCPRCWETAEISEEHLGKQGKCNSCGALVQIPPKLTKVCFICGTDVTSIRHAKDPDNNYLCLSCFDARKPEQQALFSVPGLECSMCHAKFVQGEGFERGGEPICRDCYYRHVGDDDEDEAPPDMKIAAGSIEDKPPQPQPRREAEPAAGAVGAVGVEMVAAVEKPDTHVAGFEHVNGSGRSRTIIQTRPGSFGSAVAVVALLAVGGLAYMQFSQFAPRNGEDELRLKVATLKAQAEVLVSLGRAQQGLEKYNELGRLVNGRAIANEDLRREIEAAKAAAEQVAQISPDEWEQEHLLKIIIMKSQADLLDSLGHGREAADRYREIVKLTNGRAVRNALLAGEIQAARAAINGTMAAGQPPKADRVPSASQPAVVQVVPSVPPTIETSEPPVVVGPVSQTPDPAPTTRERPPLKSIFDE